MYFIISGRLECLLKLMQSVLLTSRIFVGTLFYFLFFLLRTPKRVKEKFDYFSTLLSRGILNYYLYKLIPSPLFRYWIRESTGCYISRANEWHSTNGLLFVPSKGLQRSRTCCLKLLSENIFRIRRRCSFFFFLDRRPAVYTFKNICFQLFWLEQDCVYEMVLRLIKAR